MTKITTFYKDSITKAGTRLSILNNSIDLFTNNGIESVSMLEIAKKSNITPRTLYRYYKNKELLVIDILYHSFYLSELEASESESAIDREISGFESLKITITKLSNVKFNTKLILYFDIFILNMKKNSEAFKRYTELYRPKIDSLNNSEIDKSLIKGIKDGSIKIPPSEVNFYSVYIRQTLFSLQTRIELKEYENPTINRKLMDKQIEIILSYLGGKTL